MTLLTYLEPEYSDLAKGDKRSSSVDKTMKYRNDVRTQRWSTRSAFIVTFMAWVGEQLKNRGMSRRELAARCDLSLGTMTRHFKNPKRVATYYIPIYLYCLGVRLQLSSVPVQYLEDIPGFEESSKK